MEILIIFKSMIETTRQLYDVNQTGAQMSRLVLTYWTDLGAWLNRPFSEFYRYVCNLPYIPDPPGVETVSRPGYTINPGYAPRDCDDKAVLIASWLHGNGHKCRFVASSTKPNRQLHHVFVQLDDGTLIDATYSQNAQFLGSYPYFAKLTKIIPLTRFF